MSRADDLYGKKNLDALGTGPSPLVPFPPAGQRKDKHPYDESLVHEAIRSGQKAEPMDPRRLKSTQPSLDRAGVRHYMENPHGPLYNEGTDPGNKTPIVYHRNGNPILLSGHHRATAALLQGEQFHAIQVHGDWGPDR